MNLWLSCLFLLASILLSDSAPTPEDCQALVTPVSLEDPSVLFGRVNFLVGYTNHAASKAILKSTDSSWVKISALPLSTTEVVMIQENKMNGTCFGSKVIVMLEGNTAMALLPNMTAVFYVLPVPSCQGCLVFNINGTAKNIKQLLKIMKVDDRLETDEFNAHALYFSGPETTIKDSDLEHFKKQASCLGFSGDPDYHYNPEKVSAGFCQEGEGLRLPYSQ